MDTGVLIWSGHQLVKESFWYLEGDIGIPRVDCNGACSYYIFCA